MDVFVNNAGICPFHAFLDMPAETMERTMDQISARIADDHGTHGTTIRLE